MKPRKRRVAADQFHGSDFVQERGSMHTIIGKQRQYFGIFFSVCMHKQIIWETDTDTCICVF
jgi:hypothetical protein